MINLNLFKLMVILAVPSFVMTTGLAVTDEYPTAADLNLMEGFPPPPDKRVNKSNALMEYPFNRWSYQNMRMFYPSVGIPAADQPVELKKVIDQGIVKIRVSQPDPSGKPDGSAAGEYIPTDKTVDFATYLKETFTDSMVVIGT